MVSLNAKANRRKMVRTQKNALLAKRVEVNMRIIR